MVETSGRRYLVTGGAGFIGSHLCDALLDAGHTVVVLDDLSTGRRDNLDARIELYRGDTTDPAAVGEAVARADGIFHLAAIASVVRSNEDWPGSHAVNQGGTVRILDAARRGFRTAIPVVYASSAAIYGDAGDVALGESSPPAPLTAYGADKLGSELHARVGTLVHGVPTLGFRFFNVYGPRQDPHSPYSGVISIFARRIAEGGAVTLHGDGGQMRDFVHVADVVQHLMGGMSALEAGRVVPPVLNVCTGRPVSIRALAGMLAAAQGVPLQAEYGPVRPGDIRHSCGAPSRAVEALGIAATIRLEDGLTTLFA